VSTGGPGLRERKKRERREVIARQALALFAEYGFDSVRIADIARAADVAGQTVFNHFPAKEDIFFHQVQERQQSVLDAIRKRPPGTSVLAAVRGATEDLLTNSTGDDFRDWMAVIAASESLQEHRVKIYARLADAVASHLAAELNKGPDDLVTHAVARALIGVIAASTEIVTRKIVSGQDPDKVRRDIAAELDLAFAQLEAGLAGFGT